MRCPRQALYGEPNAVSNSVDYTGFRSRSHDAVIRVYDGTGIETHEHAGDFRESIMTSSAVGTLPFSTAITVIVYSQIPFQVRDEYQLQSPSIPFA